MVPVAVAITVVALGGGAWAVFGRGHNPPPLTPALHDTTTRQTAAVPGGLDTTRLSRPDTARTTPKHPTPGGPGAAPGPRPPAGLDSTALSAIADRLADMQPRPALDSAILVYNSSRAGAKDRAYAACVAASMLRDSGRPTEAVQWANRGLALNPTLSSCKNVLNPGGQ